MDLTVRLHLKHMDYQEQIARQQHLTISHQRSKTLTKQECSKQRHPRVDKIVTNTSRLKVQARWTPLIVLILHKSVRQVAKRQTLKADSTLMLET